MTVTAYPINASGGQPAYTARQGRQAFSALMMAGSGPLRARSGFRPGGNPAVSADASSWSVGPFSAVIDAGQSTTQGPYLVASDATETGALTAADGTYARKDILYIQVDDADEDPSGQRRARVLYQAGTPASSPSAPATPARSLLVGTIDVPRLGNGSPAFTPSGLYAVAAGGIVPVASQAERDALAAYDGLTVWRTDQDWYEAWRPSEWVMVAGRLPFRNLLKDPATGISFANATTVTITGMMVGPGDLGNGCGLSYSNGVITVSRSGLYRIEGQVGYDANASGYRQARLVVAGTTYRNQQAPTPAGVCSVPISRELSINAGQTISMEAYQTSGGTLAGLTGDFTFITIRYLGPS